MNISSVKDKCVGCSACFHNCPIQCISFNKNEEGFYYPIVDNIKCINCENCLESCPVITERTESPNNYIAARAKDNVLVSSSTSGAIFPLLASFILNNEGLVFGAAYSDDLLVEHIGITTYSQIKQLQNSKYIQSNLKHIYNEIKEKLSQGKMVLFSGTPCQVQGLYTYLQDKPDRLFTIDIVCHGVPSEFAYKEYLTWLEEKYNSQVISINFRSKCSGWRNYSIVVTFANGYQYRSYHWDDPYIRAFIKGLDLRESCYSCSFRGKFYSADLTLGDLWGADTICPEWNDDRGISLIITHSEKGNKLLNNIQNKIDSKDILYNDVILKNSAVEKPCERPCGRDHFFYEIQHSDFKKVVFSYFPDSLKYKIMKLVRRLRKGINR